MNSIFTFNLAQDRLQWRHGLIIAVLASMFLLLPAVIHAQDSNIESEFGHLSGELYENEPAYGGAWVQREPEYGFYVQFTVPNGEEILQAYADRYPFVSQIHVTQSQYSYKGLEAILDVFWDFGIRTDDWKLVHLMGIGVYEQNITIFMYSENPVGAKQAIVDDEYLFVAMAAAVDEPEPEQILNVIQFIYDDSVPVPLDAYRVLLPIAIVQ
ncbi:MAG: hypothetical protein KDD92_04360 [Caldilineaceae bacterium]|nr:hypothetical protein [Caldilineaceae bacterium]